MGWPSDGLFCFSVIESLCSPNTDKALQSFTTISQRSHLRLLFTSLSSSLSMSLSLFALGTRRVAACRIVLSGFSCNLSELCSLSCLLSCNCDSYRKLGCVVERETNTDLYHTTLSPLHLLISGEHPIMRALWLMFTQSPSGSTSYLRYASELQPPTTQATTAIHQQPTTPIHASLVSLRPDMFEYICLVLV